MLARALCPHNSALLTAVVHHVGLLQQRQLALLDVVLAVRALLAEELQQGEDQVPAQANKLRLFQPASSQPGCSDVPVQALDQLAGEIVLRHRRSVSQDQLTGCPSC